MAKINSLNENLDLHSVQVALVDLNYRYSACLDDRQYDAWPDFFVEDCKYIIHPRDNVDAGFEGGHWIYATNKKMLRDRVLSLQKVNIQDIHYDRHLISNIRILAEEKSIYHARANYLVIHTSVEGHSSIKSTGEYQDEVVWEQDKLMFKQRIVIPDTFNTDKIVAVPL